ncbi:MAG: hypothetical protein J4N84_11845 [Chloroflexi bacterium]|nr:hypothetical protein [Chloroflexota bacterium]MCI0859686.1 hypothetical protein [Chloroflexota bacterium]MCI0879753.1 hypothetical protein [Chloroflexota bacterium]MCI0895579.1 hypothetical protein [Chloroflexota bacterium]
MNHNCPTRGRSVRILTLYERVNENGKRKMVGWGRYCPFCNAVWQGDHQIAEGRKGVA